MKQSEYIKNYIQQSEIESKLSKDSSLFNFFNQFSNELKRKSSEASKGNRNVVSGSFSAAFENLIPNEVELEREVSLKNIFELNEINKFNELTKKKRIDFVITNKEKDKIFLIEFKTNLQFNDLAAAMIEMQLVQKLKSKSYYKEIYTSSIHLFPYRSNITGLKEMNKFFDSPLKDIWIFCKGPQLIFNIDEIIRFKNTIISFFDLNNKKVDA